MISLSKNKEHDELSSLVKKIYENRSKKQITILNQILIISMHIASLVKRPCYLLKLSSRNENMGMSRADKSVKN